jgi:copper chaperone CopZ
MSQKFKTNIKCDGCVAKVSPALNELLGEGKWKVDLHDPARILTTEKEMEENTINQALEKVGYKVEGVGA